MNQTADNGLAEAVRRDLADVLTKTDADSTSYIGRDVAALLLDCLDSKLKGYVVEWVRMDSGERPEGAVPQVDLTLTSVVGDVPYTIRGWYDSWGGCFYSPGTNGRKERIPDAAIIAWGYSAKAYGEPVKEETPESIPQTIKRASEMSAKLPKESTIGLRLQRDPDQPWIETNNE